MNEFEKFREKLRKNGNGVATKSTQDLLDEISKRKKIPNIFPLEVFPEPIKPFLESLSQGYDLPRSFVGLCMLSAYSTAIGTSYIVTTNGKDGFYLPVWACLAGMSSSGKTLVFSKTFKPLLNIQSEMDNDWSNQTAGMSDSQIKDQQLKTVVYRDAHIPTLVRYVIPDNPKGVVKWSDELLEWINGMNQLTKKEGTDEQFWISSWNCTPYSGIRAGKAKFVLPRPFVNVIGGVQHKILPKLFAKDRDSTGFIFRLLFATAEEEKIADADPEFEIPEQWEELHKESLNRLYKDLAVEDHSETKKCILSGDAVKVYRVWTNHMINSINKMEDLDERELNAGVFGKIKEYALRFAAILQLAEKSLDHNYDGYHSWRGEMNVDSSTMERALKLADYFYKSALETYERVNTTLVAPQEVIYAATLMKMGKPAREIAQFLWKDDSGAAKARMNRQLKKWIANYPRVFNSIAK
ncbi:DUF3987 domain-containing protein [Ekhidna sp.]|uniref:DUF3987 domain-containing protein n=1 Tax=Ekhidna sp. TaxID=2608089 RepID=UPI003B58E358